VTDALEYSISGNQCDDFINDDPQLKTNDKGRKPWVPPQEPARTTHQRVLLPVDAMR
jgi:hypothetical protein